MASQQGRALIVDAVRDCLSTTYPAAAWIGDSLWKGAWTSPDEAVDMSANWTDSERTDMSGHWTDMHADIYGGLSWADAAELEEEARKRFVPWDVPAHIRAQPSMWAKPTARITQWCYEPEEGIEIIGVCDLPGDNDEVDVELEEAEATASGGVMVTGVVHLPAQEPAHRQQPAQCVVQRSSSGPAASSEAWVQGAGSWGQWRSSQLVPVRMLELAQVEQRLLQQKRPVRMLELAEVEQRLQQQGSTSSSSGVQRASSERPAAIDGLATAALRGVLHVMQAGAAPARQQQAAVDVAKTLGLMQALGLVNRNTSTSSLVGCCA